MALVRTYRMGVATRKYEEEVRDRFDPGEMLYLEVDSVLLSEVLDYGAWPCLWNPTDHELDLIEQKRLEGLGYIR